MTGGRTVWWPKDSAWWRREHIVELGEEFGADGPAVIDWLSCEAKAQNDGGIVKAGYRTVARGSFVELVTVRHVVSRAVTLGALDDFEESGTRFTCRISGWAKDNERGRASLRQADARARADAEKDGTEPKEPDGAAVTQRDVSRSVTVRNAESLTGQEKREEKEEPPQPPKNGGSTIFPSAPKSINGKRQRDLARHRTKQEEHRLAVRAFVTEHFPDEHPDAIFNTAAVLTRHDIEPTANRIREHLAAAREELEELSA